MYDTIIYCGGKSGSTTLAVTFQHHGYKVLHIHNEEYYNKYNHKHENIPLFNLVDQCRSKQRIAVIDVYRLPIERKISSFFYNLKQHVPDYKNKTIEELIELFNSNWLYSLEEYESINEIMDHYNVPRFTYFNFVNRYNIKIQKNMIFIKLHFNDVKQWDKILSKITNRKIMIQKSNLSENKEYHQIYSEFKKQYKLPKEYLKVIENNRDFKIYNSPLEQIEYINKWKQNLKK